MIEQPFMVKIREIHDESPSAKTFFFQFDRKFEPGQFAMVWIPSLDEKPFTISYRKDDLLGITVLKRGIFTQSLHTKKVGDLIGIRGPYGNGYTMTNHARVCILGGGIGLASVATLVDRLSNTTVIHGSRTSADLLYQKRFQDMKLCTDDGSKGFCGTTVDLFVERLKKDCFQKLYACGPEKMLFKLFGLCKEHNIDCEFSLERYFKCGFGVCGQCDCSGRLVCLDGPVFNLQELSKMEDFGKSSINKTGKRIFC